MFGVVQFLQKTNERILLTTMTICFRSFFGRNRRHQKSFRNYLTFKMQGKPQCDYRTRAIVTRSFYFCNPLIDGALLANKKYANSLIFQSKICFLYLREVATQEWVITLVTVDKTGPLVSGVFSREVEGGNNVHQK